jgi:hypothetical protein
MGRSPHMRPEEPRAQWAHRWGRKTAALFTGGSVSAFVVLHVVHVASVAAAPAAFQFICRLAH